MAFNLFTNDEPGPTFAVYEFESGELCVICGLHHADQWQCDPTIPNPWGGSEEE